MMAHRRYSWMRSSIPVAMPKMIMNKAARSMMMTIKAMTVRPACINVEPFRHRRDPTRRRNPAGAGV